MDGDIGVAEQLGRDAEQHLASFARKMQLYQIKLDMLAAHERDAEREEAELTQCIKELQEMELEYKREAASTHEQLAMKSHKFQELTRQASERLLVRVLQLETEQLQKLIRDLQAKEERLTNELGGSPIVEEAAVVALVAKAQSLHKRYQQLAIDHETVLASLKKTIAEALSDRAVRVRAEEEEVEYRRQLEEAIEDMTLLQVEAELAKDVTGDVAVDDPRGGAPVEPCPRDTTLPLEAPQAALTRLALLRDGCDSQIGKLATALGARVRSNRQLAEELGLVEEEDGVEGEAPGGMAALAAGHDEEPINDEEATPIHGSEVTVSTTLSPAQKQTEDDIRVEEIMLDSDSE